MEIDNRLQIHEERDYKVVKANEIIQKARVDLTLMEQKTFCYIVSKIKPKDERNTHYTFTINEYCDVCGINRNSGKTGQEVRKIIKDLCDKSFWMTEPNGDEVLVRWLDKPRISTKRGKVTVRLDEDMQKYLLGLTSNYTQYSLVCVLPMRSAYSVRLYELLKSYAGFHKKRFEINDLKQKLAAPYINFKDFRRKALEIATKEINEYTDIEISWEPITKGRKVVAIDFKIKSRNTIETMLANTRAQDQLDGQMSLSDFGI